MSGFAIIITLLVVAMMVGPLLMMRPSKRQLQIGTLRNTAIKLGFKVQLKAYQNQTFAEYIIAWPKRDYRDFSPKIWSLEKKNYSHEIHFFNEWDWQDKSPDYGLDLDLIKKVITNFPKGVSQLSATKLGVTCLWDEVGGDPALRIIYDTLRHLSEELAA